MNTTKSFDWTKDLSSDLLKHDQVPLTGTVPNFPWEEFTAHLKTVFDLKQPVSLSLLNTEWKKSSEIYPLFKDQNVLIFRIQSFDGDVLWMMDHDHIQKLISVLLLKSAKEQIADPQYVEGFYKFLALETVHILSQFEGFKSLSIFLAPHDHPESEEAFLCKDISVKIGEDEFTGKLAIAPAFLKSWTKYFNNQTKFSSNHLDEIFLPVNAEIARTSLTFNEWSSVKPGDVVILESSSFSPENKEGNLMLSVNNIPLFKAEIKGSTIKILEKVHYY